MTISSGLISLPNNRLYKSTVDNVFLGINLLGYLNMKTIDFGINHNAYINNILNISKFYKADLGNDKNLELLSRINQLQKTLTLQHNIFDKNDINAMKGTYWYDPIEFIKKLIEIQKKIIN